MTKLFIVGFPRDTTEIILVEIFSVYGTVEKVTIVTGMETGISKGYAFIYMTDESGAARAINGIDGSSMGERQLTVKIADNKREENTTGLISQNPILISLLFLSRSERM